MSSVVDASWCPCSGHRDLNINAQLLRAGLGAATNVPQKASCSVLADHRDLNAAAADASGATDDAAEAAAGRKRSCARRVAELPPPHAATSTAVMAPAITSFLPIT